MTTTGSDISVVIPYHDEGETIETTLNLLRHQTLPAKEVIMVDSSSTDDSFQRVDAWIQRLPASVPTTFHNLQRGTNLPSSSTNVGISHATGQVLALTDCGLLFETDWLERQAAFMDESGAAFVSGVGRFAGVGLVDAAAIALTYGYKRVRPVIPSSLIRREVFDQAGLFHENIRAGYDIDFLYRVAQRQIRRAINDAVEVRYNGVNFAASPTRLFRKMVAYSEPLLSIQGYRHPYAYLCLAVCFGITALISPWSAAALLAVYGVVRGYLSALIKSRSARIFTERPMTVFVLPFVALIIDAGKVVGYSKGLFGMLRRGRQVSSASS